MDMFRNATGAVSLCSNYDKYLTADEDEEGVSLGRSGSSRNARWTVELVGRVDALWLKNQVQLVSDSY